MLHNHAMELKDTNPRSNVVIVSEKKNPNELSVFQKMYICLTTTKEGFIANCRRLIGLDGCFWKGLLKSTF